MKKNYVFFVIMGLFFFLSACSVKESTSQKKESDQIIIDTPYLLGEGSIKASKDNVAIGDINYLVTNISTISGVNDTKLALISFTVTNKTKQEINPNEFWFRYVKVTQNSDEPLSIGALPYEKKDNREGKRIQLANQPLKKGDSVDVAVAYIVDGATDLNVTFMDTEFNEIVKNVYLLKE